MSQKQAQRKKRTQKQPKVEHCRTVEVTQLNDLLIASIDGVEFCRLAYSHNRLLIALNKRLEAASHAAQTTLLMEGYLDTPSERKSAEYNATQLIQHHAAGVTAYISHNIQYILGSMLESYLNIGGLYAVQDRELQSGLDPQPITAEKIQRIFTDLAIYNVQRQAKATGGRRPDQAKERARRDMKRAVTTLRKERRKITYEEAEDILGYGGGTLKGIVRRHNLSSYWKELKKGVET